MCKQENYLEFFHLNVAKQENYLEFFHLKTEIAALFEPFHRYDADIVPLQLNFKLRHCLLKYEEVDYEKSKCLVCSLLDTHEIITEVLDLITSKSICICGV